MLPTIPTFTTTNSTEESEKHANCSLGSYFLYKSDAGDHLKAAIRCAPDAPYYHTLKGYYLMSFLTSAITDRASIGRGDDVCSGERCGGSLGRSTDWISRRANAPKVKLLLRRLD